MALVNADRVKETSVTTGVGAYDLAGAVTGFRTFVAGVATGNTCWYCATNGTDWEVGIGTVTDATPDTLSRTTILSSSNAGAAVNWGAGTKTIFCTLPAERTPGEEFSRKILAQLACAAATLEDCYTVASGEQAEITGLTVANRTATSISFRASLAIAGAADDNKQYTHYNLVIPGNDTLMLPCSIPLAATDVLRTYASAVGLSVNVSGRRITAANNSYTYKVLAQLACAATTLQDVYTVPSGKAAEIATVIIANRSASSVAFRLSLAVAGAADDNKQYTHYNLVIPGNDSIEINDRFDLATTDVLRVYAASANLSVNVIGREVTNV